VQDTTGTPITERPIVRLAIAAALIAAIVLSVLAVRVIGGDDGDEGLIAPPTAGTTVADDAPGPLTSGGPVVGQDAPDFALRSADGTIVKLSDLRGKVVFVNFWATWCKPCREELPDIAKIYVEKRAAGLEVLTINYQEDPGDARAFFTELGVELPILLDRSGSVYDQYRLQGLPDSFFVGRDGKLAALHYGYMSESKMRERLATAGLP